MKTIFRKLVNERLEPVLAELEGEVMDLASFGAPSYRRFLRPERTRITAADLRRDGAIEVDFNKRLPYADASFHHVLCVSALYIAENPVFTLKEMHRVVKNGGSVVVVTPFVFPEAREPHDYVRWTSEGLETLFEASGFSQLKTFPIGGHFTSAFYIIEPFLLIDAFRWVFGALARTLDGLVPARYRTTRPCPLGYLTIAVK